MMMGAHLDSARGKARIQPPNGAAAGRAEGLAVAASLVASIPGAVYATACLRLRAVADRCAEFLRLATRRPPRGLLAELL
jgi:hypothetical protein